MKACLRFDASLVVDVNELWSRFPLIEIELRPQTFVRPQAIFLPSDWRLVSISTYTMGAMDVEDMEWSGRPGDHLRAWFRYRLRNNATIVAPGEAIRLHVHNRMRRDDHRPLGELHVEVPQ